MDKKLETIIKGLRFRVLGLYRGYMGILEKGDGNKYPG